MDPIPTPSVLPLSVSDAQQLQIIHELNNHLLSNTQVLLLYAILGLPLPMAWKVQLYLLLSHLPLPSLTPMEVALLVIFLPVITIALLVVAFFVLRFFYQTLFPLVLRRFVKQDTKKIFLSLTFPADTSKSAYATEQLYSLLHALARQKKGIFYRLAQHKDTYSLEIVAVRGTIRYLIGIPEDEKDILQRSILSYLPGIKITEEPDYLTESEAGINSAGSEMCYTISELRLSSHPSLPLNKQKALSEHDPMMYLTGNMTKLKPGELIAYQIVTTPVLSSTHRTYLHQEDRLRKKIARGEPILKQLYPSTLQQITSLPGLVILWWMIKYSLIAFSRTIFFTFDLIAIVADNGQTHQVVIPQQAVVRPPLTNPFELDAHTAVKEKTDQDLFETAIRLLVMTNDSYDCAQRMSGLLASFAPMASVHQSLRTKRSLLPRKFIDKKRLLIFKNRLLSPSPSLHKDPILSSSEIADLYHFPYTDTTQTEDMDKVYSKELAAARSLKTTTEFDVVFGVNTYGGTETPIGINDEDRKEHLIIIGRTNSGKSTIIGTMITMDMQKNRGVALIDPHGDLSEDLLNNVPKERINDVMYCNPFDLKHPMCINILELMEGLSEDDMALQKELVCEGIISIFRRVFNDEEKVNAHRIEYILRNTIHTAFTVPEATIFTVYKLLTNPQYQKEITSKLEDDTLRDFWRNEFGKAGDFQVIKMVSGVTSKVGRFLFSPIAKRMLGNPKSTISFDDLLNNGKILNANLSEGRLGEDTSHLLGTILITKIHQAALQRQKIPLRNRTPFYLFVDEFQNFATSSFTKMLSSGRKFGLRIVLAEQTTAQQDDRNMVNVIVANIGTFISFRLASPLDEELLLSLYSPYVKKGELMYLQKHHFYIKLGAADIPEPPFSGKTLPFEINEDLEKVKKIIAASRKNYTITYQKPEINQLKKTKTTKRNRLAKKYTTSSRLLPEQEDVS